MIKENFIKIYEESFKENWALPALTDYGKSKTFTFGDVATEIARIHLLFHECQVRRGDKIALIGKDSSRWCIAYMAVVTYGAIIVPILQDFNPNDVHHIINHSESVFLFVSDRIWDSLEEDKIRLMEPDKESAVVMEKGVALTGYGILDNELHVQVRYADILETDNHGRIYLKNENGEAVYDQYSVSFRDDDGRDNYQEYVFPIPADGLDSYEIWGEFWTCSSGPIKGNWQVTFPLTD